MAGDGSGASKKRRNPVRSEEMVIITFTAPRPEMRDLIKHVSLRVLFILIFKPLEFTKLVEMKFSVMNFIDDKNFCNNKHVIFHIASNFKRR